MPEWVLILLSKYPTAKSVSRARISGLTKIRYISPEKAESLKEKAKHTVASSVESSMDLLILSLSKEILSKIEQIKDYISNILTETDKYFIRKLERDIEVPIEIIEERQFIHSECDRMKNEISNLTNIKDILTYDYQITGLNYHNIG